MSVPTAAQSGTETEAEARTDQTIDTVSSL